jgi:hypothetical protein
MHAADSKILSETKAALSQLEAQKRAAEEQVRGRTVTHRSRCCVGSQMLNAFAVSQSPPPPRPTGSSFQAASLLAQSVVATNTHRDRVESLEAQVRRADTRIEELRQQNDHLLQQVTMLSDSAARPAFYDQTMASLPSGSSAPAPGDAGRIAASWVGCPRSWELCVWRALWRVAAARAGGLGNPV